MERLGGLQREASLDQAIVIVMIANRLVGLVVDAVDEVVDLDEDSIRPADPLLGTSNNYLGVARLKNADSKGDREENYRVILLIDVDRLIRSEWSRMGAMPNLQEALLSGCEAEPGGR